MLWKRLSLVYLPGILGILGALAALGTRCFAADFEKQNLWVLICFVVSALVSSGVGVLAMINGETVIQDTLSKDAYTAMLVALTNIVDFTGIPAKEIRLSAFRLERRWWSFWTKRQYRFARVGLANYPPPKIGRNFAIGVVGECWKRKCSTSFLRKGNSEFSGESEWLKAPAEVRMGMSFREWKETWDRFALIMAVPVQGGEKYLGCVSLDTFSDRHSSKLRQEKVWNFLADAATTIGESLRGS